jgi:hypothetical protein
MLGQVVQKPVQAGFGIDLVRGHLTLQLRDTNGNADKPVVIKYSVPYIADFVFGQIKLAW